MCVSFRAVNTHFMMTLCLSVCQSVSESESDWMSMLTLCMYILYSYSYSYSHSYSYPLKYGFNIASMRDMWDLAPKSDAKTKSPSHPFTHRLRQMPSILLERWGQNGHGLWVLHSRVRLSYSLLARLWQACGFVLRYKRWGLEQASLYLRRWSCYAN